MIKCAILTLYPANMRNYPIPGLMLGQRRRRCTNIDPAMGQGIVFAGYGHYGELLATKKKDGTIPFLSTPISCSFRPSH